MIFFCYFLNNSNLKREKKEEEGKLEIYEKSNLSIIVQITLINYSIIIVIVILVFTLIYRERSQKLPAK